MKEELQVQNKKIKIAFFPYKVAMWDALDSVYRAALADENCECQVVPIPYYTKDETGKPVAMHYEGMRFPKDIPVVDYKTYFLEEERPDILYIHNPYDAGNKVTMVEPRFFSGELKKYGGILVYVPYYIGGACEKYVAILNYCCGMAAVQSDYLIMQNEEMKNAFAYCGYPTRRLLVLGSPKVDAMYCDNVVCNREMEEWKKTQEGRKIVLLNTTIKTALNMNDWLKEIRSFVDAVLEHRHLALLWRPHPLLLDSLRCMKNTEEYEALEKLLQESDKVYVDLSDSAAYGMKIADAMISDYSSLIMQYTLTGKPTYVISGRYTREGSIIFCDYFGNYFAERGDSLTEFLDDVAEGRDTRKKERMEAILNSMANTDGSCGRRVHETILEKYREAY